VAVAYDERLTLSFPCNPGEEMEARVRARVRPRSRPRAAFSALAGKALAPTQRRCVCVCAAAERADRAAQVRDAARLRPGYVWHEGTFKEVARAEGPQFRNERCDATGRCLAVASRLCSVLRAR
jgi:rhodanese-related sulfurtransferase